MNLVDTGLPALLMFPLLFFCSFKLLTHMYCYKLHLLHIYNIYKCNSYFSLSTNLELVDLFNYSECLY